MFRKYQEETSSERIGFQALRKLIAERQNELEKFPRQNQNCVEMY